MHVKVKQKKSNLYLYFGFFRKHVKINPHGIIISRYFLRNKNHLITQKRQDLDTLRFLSTKLFVTTHKFNFLTIKYTFLETAGEF